jgi:hypothetical protein
MEELRLEQNMTNQMLANMIAHYSHKVNKVFICNKRQLDIDGYRCMALLHPYLVELEIENCIKDGLQVISGSLSNLKSLSIRGSPSVSSEDLDSLSKLTNLEKINLCGLEHLDDNSVVNYSTLTKLKSIEVRV